MDTQENTNTVEQTTAIEILEVPNINEVRLPVRDYNFRIKSGIARKTQAKDIMFNLEVEFLTPEVIKTREGTFRIVGLTAQLLMIGSAKSAVQNQKFLKLFGLEGMITFEEEQMNTEVKLLEGLCFMAYQGSRQKPLQREVINNNNEVVRETITDPAGNPIYTNDFTLWPSDVKYKIDGEQFAQEAF